MGTATGGAESLYGRVLAAHDFDKTIALTSEPVKDGYSVEAAYELAVRKVLGEGALCEYVDQGGLHNRAPSQIVDQLAHHLPDRDSVTLWAKAEDLVAAKLDCLRPQLGRRLPDGAFWPRLNDGFKSYWRVVTDDPHISTGVASSGHEEFVLKTFEIHDETPPDVMVTDDDMRPAMQTLPRVLCEKPSRVLLDTLTYRWLEYIGYKPADDLDLDRLQSITTRHVIFAGDDELRDGLTATNTGVPFVQIHPGRAAADFEMMRQVVFGRVATRSLYARSE